MKNNISISLCLLLGLIALATFINFSDSSVEAAYQGLEIPSALNDQTLYYNDGWQASSALESDGSDLKASGNISAAAFINSSDLAKKENVEAIDNALLKVLSLDGVSFTCDDGNKKELGLIASDTEELMPELVLEVRDDLEVVKYNNVVTLLVEAIKDQQVQISELQTELKALKK